MTPSTFHALRIPVLAVCLGILIVTVSVLCALARISSQQKESTVIVKAIARQHGLEVH